MSDRAAYLVAAAAFAGSLHPVSFPGALVVAGVALALSLLWGRPTLVMLSVGLLCAVLAARSWNGLEAAAPSEVDGTATVVTDPERRGAGTTALIRIDGRRYLASGWGGTGFRLSEASAGDTLDVQGSVSAYTGPRERQAAYHASLRLSVSTASIARPGALHWRIANTLRAVIERGGASLSPGHRSLFTGLVYGDDRLQEELTAADFRVAGLTHLLAVSGQNVAYLLALMQPVMSRLTRRVRWVAGVLALLIFATATRFEPSVLRATAMALLALTGRAMGREVSTMRSLALAITALLIIDPLLAETVAFRLSSAATAGIAAWARSLEAKLKGPAAFRSAMAVTVSAQVAVAPLLIATFGPISLVSVPANVAAAPAAGLIMMWGMTGGVIAGLLGGAVATLLHSPTRALLWWLETVARLAATAPVPSVGFAGLALLLGGLALVTRGGKGRVVGSAWLVAATMVMLAPTHGIRPVGYGSTMLSDDRTSVLIVADEWNAVALIDDLRAAGIRHLDVAIGTDPQSTEVVESVRQRIDIDEVWAPPPNPSSDSTVERTIAVADALIRVTVAGPGLAVEIER